MTSSPSPDTFHFWTIGTTEGRDYAQRFQTEDARDALRQHAAATTFDWAHPYQHAYVSPLFHDRPDGQFTRKNAAFLKRAAR
jgi:hypothetical protein